MRTWTLVDTLLLGGGTLNTDGLIAVDASNDMLYTFTSGVSPHVFAYNGTTETDISAATFNGGAGSSMKGICWFSGGLYVLWFDPTEAANDRQRVYKYDGSGTSWTAVYNHTDGIINGGKLRMACDDDRIVIQVSDSTGDRLIASTDGAAWASHTISGIGVDDIGEIFLFGNEHYTGYTEILGYSVNHSIVIAYSTGTTWVSLGGAAGFTYSIGGYAGGDFWAANGDSTPAFKLARTDDFVTYSDTSETFNDGYFSQFIFSVAAGADMYRYGNDNQAWTYDGLTFVEDGTTGSDNIKAFFKLDSTLFALCDGGEVYSGGPADPPDLRLLGLAADNTNLYLTAIGGEVLEAKRYDLANLELQAIFTAGAADYGDPDTLTHGIYPVTKPGSDGLLFLRGRDGSDVHVQFSDDSGATFTGMDDVGWAAAKFCVALLPDPLAPVDLVACFSDNDLYRSEDEAATWTKTADAPVNPQTAARHTRSPSEVLLAGQTADTIRFTNSYGESFNDVSAVVGTISAIEVSR